MEIGLSWISILFGAFGLGVLQLTWESIKFFISRRDKKIEKSDDVIFNERQREVELLFNDLISGAVKIQELIEEFTTENDASRVLLLKLENGGGVPQLGTVQHMSVLNEAINSKFKTPYGHIDPVKQDFQNYIIDSEYQRVMMKMITDKIFISVTSNLENGLLKKIYEINGTVKSIFFPVTQIPSLDAKSFKGFMIYMSIEFVDDRKIDSRIEANYIIMQGKIEQIFREFYVKRISIFN